MYPFNPNQEILLPLNLTLPERYLNGGETIKVFATIKQNDFRWLELPSLDEEIGKKAQNLDRGDNPLGQLLAAVGAEVDRPPELTRAAVPIFDPSQEWTTKDIKITLTR